MCHGRPEIEQQGAGVEDVGEEPVQHRHPQDAVIFLHPHHEDDEADHVGAAGEGDAGDHVESDPESPRELLGEIGDRSESAA